MSHNFSSFSYKVTHPKVTEVLKKRSLLDNTIQMAMPFVKATTTIGGKALEPFLGPGNNFFTLGIHTIDMDVYYQDMYASTNGSNAYPLVGYTYTPNGKNQLVYASSPEDVRLAKFFDAGRELATNTPDDFLRIPPPGITKATVGKNKNGLLASAEMTISVPSLSQLEVLHRTFLIPGVGMIFEWGQQFTKPTKDEFDSGVAETGLDTDFNPKAFEEYMFPWYDAGKRDALIQRLAAKEVGIEEILNCYVYTTEGQYQWMFGRVANFSTKANTDGSFDCNVKIVGPSEDSWAYSTRQTIAPSGGSDRVVCPDGANSVESYFTSTAAKGLNLKTLLDGVKDGKILPAWKSHVKWIRHGNQKGGEPEAKTKTPVVNEQKFFESEDAYFMTWRFFVNVVLNHPVHGVRAIFYKGGIPINAQKKISLLRPYGNPDQLDSPGDKYIDDPNEPFVGYNPYLRSINPAVMMIINEQAATLATQEQAKNRAEPEARKLINVTNQTKQFADVGLFDKSTSAYKPDASASPLANDKGFLSAGVWLNHKTVAASMASSDTVLRGVTTLLDQMSAATRGYWNLSLDASEPNSDTIVCGSPSRKERHDYVVIDVNYRENADRAVDKLKNNIHVFNKHVRVMDGKLVGSDVIDCNVDLSLPKLMFSQIATLGLVQPQDLQSAGSIDSSVPEDQRCSSATMSTPQESLRKMFAITSLAAPPGSTQSPDLTIISPVEKPKPIQCGQRNVQTTAGTAGQGNQAGARSAQSVSPSENTREFPGLNDVFRYVEAFPEVMVGNIRCDANGNKSNAFGASPGALSIKADITIPGINGFRIGELFWIDRIPAFYKAFGAFQIISIEDTIDTGGWQTKLHAQFNYLGNAWTKSMESILK